MAELVYDIGMMTGDDTAYYLHLGYRVVGVEANPLRAAECLKRFETEARDGRLIVVNAGVMREEGRFPFFRNLRNDGNSTFCEPTNDPGEWERIEVSCVPMASLIAEHGKAFFIKSDIEGADFQVLEGLTPQTCPKYISLELNLQDQFVARLVELGYTAFKFVDGETFRASEPIFPHERGWRALRKAGRIVPPVRSLIRRLPKALRPNKDEWDDLGIYNPDGYPYTPCSSGPFGEHAAGEWMDARAAQVRFGNLIANHKKAGYTMVWWDIHARLGRS
jgi:FkbM family methyltransferase